MVIGVADDGEVRLMNGRDLRRPAMEAGGDEDVF